MEFHYLSCPSAEVSGAIDTLVKHMCVLRCFGCCLPSTIIQCFGTIGRSSRIARGHSWKPRSYGLPAWLGYLKVRCFWAGASASVKAQIRAHEDAHTLHRALIALLSGEPTRAHMLSNRTLIGLAGDTRTVLHALRLLTAIAVNDPLERKACNAFIHVHPVDIFLF